MPRDFARRPAGRERRRDEIMGSTLHLPLPHGHIDAAGRAGEGMLRL
jgi:hypothetical protein